MRIVHLLNHCNHGHGNAHVAVDLACAQAAAGHEVAYASGGGDYEELLKSFGVSLVEVVQTDRRPSSMTRACGTLVGLCRAFKPDIIHAHMMGGAVLGYLASRVTRATLVTTVHNSFDRHSILMRLGDWVVAVSEAERRTLLSRGYPAGRLKVVLNGPNRSPREMFWSDLCSAAPRRPGRSVTTVCGLHRRKGVPDLLQAFAQVSRRFPKWSLNIVGQGPDEAYLVKLAEELGIAESVHFCGMLASPRATLENTDIFVLASHADPCSLAVCEARFAGCAIVATSVGGTPELLSFGEAGILVGVGRPDQIAATLSSLMGDLRALADWRKRAKEGSEHLTVTRVARDYIDVYETALQAAR